MTENVQITLRPVKTMQRLLLSTTARFTGEYDAGGILLSHAWPETAAFKARSFPGPASRNAFVFSYTTKGDSRSSNIEEITYPLLSLLFGKRFDSHGLIQDSGQFHLPDLSPFSQFCDDRLPHNSHNPRIDFPVPLKLDEVRRIAPLLIEGDDVPPEIQVLHGSARFYCLSLQNAEHNPEVAYLHLVTAGEILSSVGKYTKEELLDDEIRAVLDDIRQRMPGGDQAAGFVANRLLQVKRRFVKTIVGLVDAAFFDRTQAREKFAGFQSQSFEDAMAAAYDLRSQYVHTGIPFGMWISPRTGTAMRNEVQMGEPIVGDRAYQKVLKRAPVYIGLERAIRYALLRFAQSSGVNLNGLTSEEPTT